MPIQNPIELLRTLCSEPRETEWLEFKLNRFDPHECGKYISALANSAMLRDRNSAYMVYGVENGSHAIHGTIVRLKEEKVGNEPFENWLSRLLEPRLNIEFLAFEDEGKHIEIIAIDPAYVRPVLFSGEAYVRVDSALSNLPG